MRSCIRTGTARAEGNLEGEMSETSRNEGGETARDEE